MILVNGFGIKCDTLWKIDFISSTEYLYLLLTIANYFWELCPLIFTEANELDFHLEFRFLEKKSNMKMLNCVKKVFNERNHFIVLFTLLSLSHFFSLDFCISTFAHSKLYLICLERDICKSSFFFSSPNTTVYPTNHYMLHFVVI